VSLVSRKDFLRLAGGAIAIAGLPSAGSAAAEKRSAMGRTLIRGADVLTMDPQLGELKASDVLIDQGRLVKVGNGKDPAGAQVFECTRDDLMPGLIDGHRHHRRHEHEYSL
jgi:imidazolonepropionase-like amidohydrolase